jgi:predicted RNA-binding protein with RPS1 domain
VAMCFEVQVNGDQTIAAGRPALDVLTAIVTYVRSQNELELRAGGLQRHADGSSEHVEWIARTLAVGDEIRIRVSDVDSPAEPLSITREDIAKREQSEREYYERLKRKYETERRLPPADESAL